MAGTGRTVEETFNLALGEALRRTAARWRETPAFVRVEETASLASGAAKRPDILVLDDISPPVAVECSFDGADADRDAVARLGESTTAGGLRISTAVAVFVPERYRRMDFAAIQAALSGGGPIGYALHQRLPPGHGPEGAEGRRRWPGDGFLDGTVRDLAALLPAAALPKEEIEELSEEIALLVKGAASGLRLALPAALREEIAELMHQRTPLGSFHTAMILWLNALLIQTRLVAQGVPDIPPVPFMARASPAPSQQAEAWRAILDRNWRSVFEPAVGVLERAGSLNSGATSQVLRQLIGAVERIEVSRLGPHIDVGAELFPKLSEDRKEAAAFYTQPAAAELLAGLAIRRGDLAEEEWRDGALFRRRRLADLACGTGTLLRAGYRRVAAFHEQAGGGRDSARELHRGAMESGLVGTDISPIAAHLTAASLAAIGHGEPYGDTQIGWIDVGGANDAVGSLEYLEKSSLADLFAEVAGRSAGNGDGNGSVHVPDASLDWALMNPPYSRTRGGQSAFDVAGLSEAERKACQRRWGRLARGEPVNNKAGMAASFLALARKKVRPGGRIGFVLPLTAAFAESWAVTRRMVEREFEDIVAVAVAGGRALGRDALSADTGMEEMLLAATRRAGGNGGAPAPVRCVMLREPLARPGEAGEVARAIDRALDGIGGPGAARPVRAGRSEIGTAVAFDAGGEGGPWGPLGVTHADLALAADALARGRLEFEHFSAPLGVPMAAIGEVFEVGPTHDRIGHPVGGDGRGAFEFHPVAGPLDAIGSDRALWRADAAAQRRLVVPPTHKGSAPVHVGSDAARAAMRARRGTLFHARNMRWTSQALLAATTETPVMGGRAWTALVHPDARVLRAFALWANATPGMAVHWTRGQRTHSGRSTAQIDALKRTPCPRLDRLDDAALDRAAADFEALAARDLRPACQAHADEARIAIDEAVLRMLGLPEGAGAALSRLRLLWCAEPSVHGANRAALRLLREAGMGAASGE